MRLPADELRNQLADRLSIELGDAVVGSVVAEQLDPRATEVFVRHPELVASELLSFSSRIEPAPEVLVVFAFGNRFDEAGGLLPGPVNRELAGLADAWAEVTGLPVMAQWEVADEMHSAAVRIGVVVFDDGSIEYLSTAGVAQQVRDLIGPQTETAPRVAVLAMADHAVRCCRTLERVGCSAGVADGFVLPSTYDPKSGQPWTRDRASYVAIDILARCLRIRS